MQDPGASREAGLVVIRRMELAESWYLRIALLLSIHIPAGEAVPDESILSEPPFAATLENWGRDGDIAMVAADTVHAGALVGAGWVRTYSRGRPTYGYVADGLPVLALAVSGDYRGKGVGSRLLAALIAEVRGRGYPGISLSVDPRNRALRLYERFGFEPIEAPRIIANDGNPVMAVRF